MNIHNVVRAVLDARVLQYGFLGIAATLIHVSLAFLWLYFYEESFVEANIIGFSVAFLFSYLSQSKYVFQSQRTISNALRYLLVQSVSLGIALVITQLLRFGDDYIKTVLVVLVIPVVTFITHKLWTFKLNKVND